MAVDLNADVGKIIKDFLSGKKSGDPNSGSGGSVERENYKQAALKSVLIISISAAIIWGIDHISATPIEKAESDYQTVEQLEAALSQLEVNMITAKNLFNTNKKRAKEVLPEYSGLEGSKNLFNLISTIAEKHEVILKNITKGQTRGFNNPIQHNKETILVELETSYAKYLKFKNEIFDKKAILRVISEKIKLERDPYTERQLSIVLVLEDYSLDKSRYEEIIAKDI